MSMVRSSPQLCFDELPKEVTTSLPFLVRVKLMDEHGEAMPEYTGAVTIQAVTTKVCFAEGFERRSLGLWCALERATACMHACAARASALPCPAPPQYGRAEAQHAAQSCRRHGDFPVTSCTVRAERAPRSALRADSVACMLIERLNVGGRV